MKYDISTKRFFQLSMLSIAVALTACGQSQQNNEKPVKEGEKTESTDVKTEESKNESAEGAKDTKRGDAITIYSSRKEQLIKPLLDKYTEETGTKIELVTDKPGPLIERLKAEGANTSADLLLTVDAGNLWQAGEKGLLKPFTSKTIEENVPAKYRDPQNLWTGLTLRARTIFYNPQTVKESELSTYENLGDASWQGKLCLRTSKKVYNQSLVASMIHNLGAEKAEKAVQGWVKNLKTDVFSDDTSLLKAINSGQCAVGIANTYYYGRMLEKNPDLNVKPFWANQGTSGTHVNISGAGLVANTNSSEEATKLIEWLSSDKAQAVYSSADKEYPVKAGVPVSDMLKAWGEFKADEMNVSLFGKMQSESIQLMDKAQYK